MNWALACKTGKAKNCPTKIKKVGQSMSVKQLRDFGKISEDTTIKKFEMFVTPSGELTEFGSNTTDFKSGKLDFKYSYTDKTDNKILFFGEITSPNDKYYGCFITDPDKIDWDFNDDGDLFEYQMDMEKIASQLKESSPDTRYGDTI